MKLQPISIAACLLLLALAPQLCRAQWNSMETAYSDGSPLALESTPLRDALHGAPWDANDSMVNLAEASLFEIGPGYQISQVAMQQSSQITANGGSSSNAGSGGGGGGASAGEQAQNPIASLVSLPLQSNWNFGQGPFDRTQYVGLLQPVIPVQLNENWSWINRPIIPFVNNPIGFDTNEHGLGDLQWESVFVPKPAKGSHWMWGVGVDVTMPTASDPLVGRGKWAVGPAFVLVYTKSPVVAGAILTQSYEEAGGSKPFFLQAFYNYNFSQGCLKTWFISALGDFGADWEAPSDVRWRNVIGAGPGKNLEIFGQKMQVKGIFRGFLDSPTDQDWQFQLTINYLFPK